MLVEVLEHSLMITSFVFIMMLLIEYINVQTRGSWQESLRGNRWGQYLLGALLGAVPGCLGAFTVVSLFSHRVVSLGALVATMIATSGDEAFVMFSLFPLQALILTVVLVLVGILAGFLTDLLPGRRFLVGEKAMHGLELHVEEVCHCFPRDQILAQLKNISFPRALLMSMLLIFTLALVSGSVGPGQWSWVKITLLAGSLFALFVTTTVPDHFLEEHLWEHVMKQHLRRIFFWTFGALLVIHLLDNYLDVQAWIRTNQLMILLLAVLLGVIPESGPHLVFVTLYVSGSIPFSILLASSIVQDGHGMLPMLAVSKRSFVAVKTVNVLVGLLVGLAGLLSGRF